MVRKPFVTRATISSKTMSTKASNARISSFPNDKDTLRGETKAWLEIPVGSWTQTNISKGRFLIREWSVSTSRACGNYTLREQAVAQTQIIRRWVEERRADKYSNDSKLLFQTKTKDNHSNSDSREMVEMLNRCLDSWRKAGATTAQNSWNHKTPQAESMQLVELFCDASRTLNDKGLYPTSKSYSMCMNVLVLRPESPTVCDNVLSLLEQCRDTTQTDLQFYNVCLHTLAKCASYHAEAPTLVERIFREMTTVSGLAPNTACFVSVLHAWANSIPGNETTIIDEQGAAGTTSLAAERAEAILKQMIRNYPQLIDTICFNICIDAWGKQGHPEKTEAILWQLQQYHKDNPSKTQVRPNQISFNSAITAWSKSASNSKHRNIDPQKAADRATRLLQQMRAQGLEPTSETFGSIMEAYSKTPNPGIKVQSFLDELEKLHSEGQIALPPPKICYLMAIQAWGRSKPKGAERAESLVQRLERICTQEGGEREELEPCTILYTALIAAWAQSDMDHAPDRAKEIFREMLQKSKMGRSNLFPNSITVNTIVEAFCNHNRIDEGLEFLERAKRVVSPGSKSYLTILKAYANSGSEDAAQKAQDMLSSLQNDYNCGHSTMKPTIRMYSQVLVALGNSRRSDGAFRAEEFFWRLLQRNDDDDDDADVVPDTATFNCVLRAWSKSSEGGAAERAEAFLQKVQEEHSETIAVDPISHLHLIYAWAHSRRRKAPKEAEKHLEQARALCKNMGWRLTKAHFNGVILAWKKSSDSKAEASIQKLRKERDSAALG